MANLHVMRDSNLLDVAATLRNIAANIEAGAYGEPIACMVVLDADKVELFSMGAGKFHAAEMHLLLGVAQHKMQLGVLNLKE